MKTKKALIITSIFQILYCNGCIGTVLGFALARHYQLGVFYTFSKIGAMALALNPTGLVCFIITLAIYLKERRAPEAKAAIGRKWIWIYIWLAITTVFYAASVAILYAITR